MTEPIEPDEEIIEEIEENEREAVEEALRRIKKDDADGLISPDAVVEAARDPRSALHRFFTWDDSAAAEMYRKVQARQLIRTVVVREHNEPALHYVNVKVKVAGGAQRRGYVDRDRIIADDDLFEQVIADVRARIVAQQNKLESFERARDIRTGLRSVVEQIDKEYPNARKERN